MPDGSVVSSFFDVASEGGQKEATRRSKIIEGQVVRIHYTDDASNKSKKFVEYDVIARESYGQAVTYKNCLNILDIGGTNNYSEQILESNEVAFQGKLEDSNFPVNMNGTMVKLAFIENLDRPVIIGGQTHRRTTGATRKEGIRSLRKFNGVTTNINKDGEWTQTHEGPSKPNGELTRPDTGPNTFSVNKEGNYEFKQETRKENAENELINSELFDRKNKTVTRKVGKDVVVEEWNGDSEKKTIKLKSGLEITYDGKGDTVTYTTSGGATVSIDGSGTITLDVNGTVITIDGSTGKIELTGQLVDVGEAASELAVLGSELVSWLSTHTHTGNQGSPTSPPITPPPPSMLSTSVKIKK